MWDGDWWKTEIRLWFLALLTKENILTQSNRLFDAREKSPDFKSALHHSQLVSKYINMSEEVNVYQEYVDYNLIGCGHIKEAMITGLDGK